jgi:predicted transcriptional regulator
MKRNEIQRLEKEKFSNMEVKVKKRSYTLTKSDGDALRIVVLIQGNPGLTIEEVSKRFGDISYKAAQRCLRKLVDQGILFARIEKENPYKYRYYPNPNMKEFFESTRLFLRELAEIKHQLGSG